MNTKNICPGCGEVMRMVGAVAVMRMPRGGGVAYSVCPKCTRVMRAGDEAERAELLEKIEMSLAAEGRTAQ